MPTVHTLTALLGGAALGAVVAAPFIQAKQSLDAADDAEKRAKEQKAAQDKANSDLAAQKKAEEQKAGQLQQRSLAGAFGARRNTDFYASSPLGGAGNTAVGGKTAIGS